MLAIGLLAPHIAPFDPIATDLRARLAAPGAGHWLGTDHLGRDLLSRLLFGVRTSVVVAVLGVAIGAVFGTLLGLFAAHFRGLAESGLGLAIDSQAALPYVVIAVGAIAVFGSSFAVLLAVLALSGWERYARLVQATAKAAQNEGYAAAGLVLGGTWPVIYLRHVLPNVASPLLVAVTLNFPQVIVLESALSFLGLGVQPPFASLGTMLNDGKAHMSDAAWIVLCPAAVLFVTTCAVTILGDRLQETILSPAPSKG